MKYSIDEVIEYSKNNELDKWIQLFLRDGKYKYSNPNIPFADGLLLEERFYTGPIIIDFDKITPKRIEEHLEGHDLKDYERIVNRISNDYSNYNLPPLILEYRDDKLYLTDGNHRFSALRKLNINKYYAIIWTNIDKKNELINFINNLEGDNICK